MSLIAAPAATLPSPDAAQACAREPIHRLGSIQAHGAVLVLDQAAQFVRNASASVDRVLHVEADAALGAPAADLLPGWLLSALVALPADADQPVRLAPPRGARPPAPEIFAHRGDDGLVVEFIEPTRDAPPATAAPAPAPMTPATSAGTFRDAHALARAAHALTGFQRAMVYRFRPDWSGEVIAEVRAEHLTPFLGLRFPAGDIPAQARALYVRNLVRVTADAEEAQVPMLPPGAPPDLGMALLRSVSPVHLEYLRAMDVRSSIVASILVEDRLWGLLACHHDQPAMPPAAVREGLGRLAAGFAPVILRQKAHDAALAARHVAAAETRISIAAARPGRLLPHLLAGPENLMRACEADGAAWTDGAMVLAAGIVPPPRFLRRLAAQLAEAAGPPPALAETDQLPRETDLAGQAAGMLAATLPGGAVLALFRGEFVHEVCWGGNPTKPTTRRPDGAPGPRTSFALWREAVCGTALPWREADRGVVLAAARAMAQAAATWPAQAEAAWDELLQLGLRDGRADLRLADLTHDAGAFAVTDGQDGAAVTLFVSDALRQLAGAQDETLPGRPWRDVAERLGIAHAFHSDGHVQDRSIEAWSPDRGLIGLSVSRAPLLQLDAPDRPGRSLSLIRVVDQTRASRAEAAMDAAESRSDRMQRNQGALLRTLTHELRSPVHAVMGLAELVADIDDGQLDDARVYGAELLATGRHMLSLIDAMLDLARIEAGQAVPAREPIDLADVVREAGGIGAPLLAARAIRFARSIPPDRIAARGDARMLRQAVVNLLANAAKFTPAGGRVDCTLVRAGRAALITVADTGPGIAPDQQARIFEPFFQGEGAARRHHGGLGLGLFIARTFVGLHGGRLTLDSSAGAGARFRIELPLV
jgi:light-regulated signal transduction histidine kinase (bacteriophytochrome)